MLWQRTPGMGLCQAKPTSTKSINPWYPYIRAATCRGILHPDLAEPEESDKIQHRVAVRGQGCVSAGVWEVGVASDQLSSWHSVYRRLFDNVASIVEDYRNYNIGTRMTSYGTGIEIINNGPNITESDFLILFFWCEIGCSIFTFFYCEDGRENLVAMSYIIIQSLWDFNILNIVTEYNFLMKVLFFSSVPFRWRCYFSEVSHFVDFAALHISMTKSWWQNILVSKYCNRLCLLRIMFLSS